MKLAIFLKTLSLQLDVIGESSRLEAELLAAHVLNFTRAQLYARLDENLSEAQVTAIQNLVKRRLSHEPIAYILGHKEFWSLDLQVTPDTLIPRPETEDLVEWVLNHLSADKHLEIVDLGTGSGAIALALAHERPNWKIIATDRSEKALAVAKSNAQQLKINNVDFRLGSWCDALPSKKYPLIISNPPYIAEHDSHLELLQHEPLSALVANDSGIADLRTIIINAKNYMNNEAYLVLEHGYDQGQGVRKILLQEGYQQVETHLDLNGNERFTSSSWPKADLQTTH